MLTMLKDKITKWRNPWLTNKISNAKVEADYQRRFPPPLWEQFKGEMIKGDEIWEFQSPPKTWDMYIGRAGIALVRNGKIIYSLVTRMN